MEDDKKQGATFTSDDLKALEDVLEADAESKDDGDKPQTEIPSDLPVLPVRDIVVFNYMILPLFVGRDKSIKAVEEALNANRYLLVLAQHEEGVDDPAPEDVYTMGTVVMIMRMLKMPDGRLKVLVQGLTRARVNDFSSTDPFLRASIEILEEPDSGELTLEQEAMMRAAKEQSERILSLRGASSPDILAVLNSVEEPGRLADLIASNLRMKVADAQQILECVRPIPRLSLVNEQLVKEVEVASMQAKIQNMAKEGMDKAQKDFFLREQMKAIRKELGRIRRGERGDRGTHRGAGPRRAAQGSEEGGRQAAEAFRLHAPGVL